MSVGALTVLLDTEFLALVTKQGI